MLGPEHPAPQCGSLWCGVAPQNSSQLKGIKQHHMPVWAAVSENEVCRKGPTVLVMPLGMCDWIPHCGQIQLGHPLTAADYLLPNNPPNFLAFLVHCYSFLLLLAVFYLLWACLEPIVTTVMTAERDQHSSLGISLLMPSQLAALATCIAEVWNHQILSTLAHWQQNRCHPGVSAIWNSWMSLLFWLFFKSHELSQPNNCYLTEIVFKKAGTECLKSSNVTLSLSRFGLNGFVVVY